MQKDGSFQSVQRVAAPPLTTNGLRVEGDPATYLDTARDLLKTVISGLPNGHDHPLLLGIASQRSTFILWDGETGVPETPMISWQDRRAESWCTRRSDLEQELIQVTGLLLSPHYVGPKLASMQDQDPELRAAIHSGRLLFGNLDTYLVWCWTRDRCHRTDLTMAARTAMVDINTGDWSASLLAHYDVPASILPQIGSSDGIGLELEPWPGTKLILSASLADQASGALTIFQPGEQAALVNLGTGAFVLCPAKDASERRPGYLTAPIMGSVSGDHLFSMEGTINGAGPAVDQFGSESAELPDEDPFPGAFAVPDLAGLGAPHWIPEFGLTLSATAKCIDRADQRRTVIEGVLFRVFEILEDLFPGCPPGRVVVSGGLSHDPAVSGGFASLLGRSIEIAPESETTLLGVTRLAAGQPACLPDKAVIIAPGNPGQYLAKKYLLWRSWFEYLLDKA